MEIAGFIPIFVMLIFGLVFILFLILLIFGIHAWQKNNNSPIVVSTAKVVNKRVNAGSMGDGYSSNAYYVTFEPVGHPLVELRVKREEHHYYQIGYEGMLRYQGIRFISFQLQ